jgi:hypothetical protein
MKLGVLAIVLILVAIAGYLLSGYDNQLPAFAAIIALFLLAELPGARWMLRGGPRLAAALMIYGLPLIIFETVEYVRWKTYCPCGDKEIHPLMMSFVIPVLVALTGTLVLIASLVARRRLPE